jgi:uncharacterized protein (TIRG00374 family)
MKNKVLLLVKIILSGILLTYLFTIIPLPEILHSIKSAEIILVLIGLALFVPINYLSALETQYLTRVQGISLSVFEILKIHIATDFYGFFLPGTLSGGAVKWFKLSKHGKKSSAAAVVVFNRFLEILMLVFTGILFSLPVFYSSGNDRLFVILVLIFFLMVIIYFLLINKSGLDSFDKYLSILPLPNFIKEIIEKLSNAMRQFQNLQLKDHLEVIGLLLLYHTIGVFSFFCFAKSLDINLSIWTIGWIRSAIALIIMLPLSFAGLGIREGTLVILLSQYGVTPNVSMALSFLFFFRKIIISLLGGLFELKNLLSPKRLREKEVEAAQKK